MNEGREHINDLYNLNLDLLFPKPAKRSTSSSKPSSASSSFLLSLDIAGTPQSDNTRMAHGGTKPCFKRR